MTREEAIADLTILKKVVFNEALDLAITALQEYEPWVSVEERLPTKEDADEYGYVQAWSKLRGADNEDIKHVKPNTPDHYTHWKPLPAKPKDGEE